MNSESRTVEIANDVQQQIHNGRYRPGARIPSYRRLAELHEVSVATAQRAVLLLRDRRLVIGVQGRGVYVAEGPYHVRPSASPGDRPAGTTDVPPQPVPSRRQETLW